MSIAENYRRLQDDIGAIAQRCGRNPSDILLVAVTKFQPWEAMAPLYELGCRHFGESRIQEAAAKVTAAPKDINWHYIGTLQKNKVRKAIEMFSLIHAVDSVQLACKIAECAAEEKRIARILLQVNTSGELSKHGLSTDQWKPSISELWELPSLQIEGLMTMAPLDADESTIRRCFSMLRDFREEVSGQTKDPRFIHLSMGMSHDYPYAIAEGATILRVGTKIWLPSKDK